MRRGLLNALLAVFVFVSFAALSIAQNQAAEEEDKKAFPCHSLPRENYTCAACLQFHDSCAWCSRVGFEDANQHPRCDSVERLRLHGCGDEHIEKPQTSMQITKDEPLANEGTEESDAVQLKPQEILVNIRPKAKVKFNVTYRQAIDYPVDLYFLMDFSFSMKDDKNMLSKLGDSFAARMRQITKNFRLGFGSFIDKTVMPFIDSRPEMQTCCRRKEGMPCMEWCAPPYGFKNQMSLTTNTERFSEEVKKAEIATNLDSPEGGFDAIMQVLSCNDVIGWRERARKMVVFSTDAGFHYAGDGRLAGLVEPNDGRCHLDARGYYNQSLDQDYPSFAQLHQKIRERKANLIFAVANKSMHLYEQLRDALPDISSSVGVLADDSSNIVELIEGEYRKISEKIIMVDNAGATQGLKLSYRSKCLGTRVNDTNVCDSIKVGDEVTFEVTLEATHCVDQRDFVLKIGPTGLDETFNINVHVMCDCDCAKEDIVRNSSNCNYKGDLVCGICTCSGTNVGRKCECDAQGQSSTAALDAKCKRTNESAICEGRGVCNCGECECNTRDNVFEKFSGTFCECDNFNCPRHDLKICAGHGSCDCGQCTCNAGWTGRACDCTESKDSCLSANGKVCNGHGDCICGRCRCRLEGEDSRYSGPKCEICPTCPTKCAEYQPCVMCQQFKTGPYDIAKCAACPFTVIPVKELPISNDTQKCNFVDPADGCTFYFLYHYNEMMNNMTVWVRDDKECPGPVPVLPIVLGVTGGIILLGVILLLLWKLLTFLHDRAEYAKFEKERAEAKWNTEENPIFKQATTTFQNPAFGKKQQ
uniref:Integrin beta n=1 Tax=Plectus sambesii TaxID=2011161 RepID=A0A914VH59_9BILA